MATRIVVIFAYCAVLFFPGFHQGVESQQPGQMRWDGQIKGHVKNDSGSPLKGVVVSLKYADDQEIPVRRTVTLNDGSYRFDGLRGGKYEITFSPGTPSEQQRIVRLRQTNWENLPWWFRGSAVVNVQLRSFEAPSPVPSATQPPPPSPLPSSPPSPRPTPSHRPTPNYNANSNQNTNAGNSNTSINVNARAQGISLDDQLRNLLQGKITYKIPQVMKLGQEQTIRINIAKELTNQRQQAAAATGAIVADLPIGDTMDVGLEQLESGAFDIHRQHPPGSGPAWQAIAGDQPSEWIYNVKPLQAGTHTLRLVAVVQLKNSYDQTAPYSFTVYEDATRVSTSYWYYAREFVRKYWQFLLTAILIPLIIPLVVRLWRSRRRPPASPTWEREP